VQGAEREAGARATQTAERAAAARRGGEREGQVSLLLACGSGILPKIRIMNFPSLLKVPHPFLDQNKQKLF